MKLLTPRESLALAILHLTAAREILAKQWAGIERVPGYEGVFYYGIPFQLSLFRQAQDALRAGADPREYREVIMLARSVIGAVRYGES